MRVTVDTNVIVRIVTQDDEIQARVAEAALDTATAAILTVPMLCELAWVLSRAYRTSAEDIADIIRDLAGRENAQVDWPAVESGLAVLEAGGDFADGVISYEGRRMGAEMFVSFDRKAVRLLDAQRQPARLLA